VNHTILPYEPRPKGLGSDPKIFSRIQNYFGATEG